MVFDFIVIGGGLVGMATAAEINRSAPSKTIALLEKEPMVGKHQSTHNSGVLHCGLYYKPGSLKARMAVQGIRRMTEFCQRYSVPHEICGKVVVATTEDEVARLHLLHERGIANGLRDLKWLSAEGLQKIEPHAAGLAALHVPEEGIVDYAAVCRTMYENLLNNGVEVKTNSRVLKLIKESLEWRVATNSGEYAAKFIINCAGLHSDMVARASGVDPGAKIIPFRGEYYQLKPDAQYLVKNLIYPVPDPTFPFLGVHFTRMISGGVEAGPNAVLAFAREGYKKSDINLKELWGSVSYAGLWKFLRKHQGMAWEEVTRSFSKKLFCHSLQRLVPALQGNDLVEGGAGVRAQAMLKDGTLEQDFHFKNEWRALHVINAPSPAATSSLAIGQYIAEQAMQSAA